MLCTEPAEYPDIKSVDDISHCENCGIYGYAQDFHVITNQGEFCSKDCVTKFAG